MKRKKYIYALTITLALSVAMIMGVTQIVSAESDEVTGHCYFNGSDIVCDFDSDVVVETVKGLEPGDDVTFKVKFENRQLVEIEGTEQEIKCDILIIAAGFVGAEDYIAKESKVELTQRGTVKTDPEQYQTSVPKVFTAGDMHRGQSLVVWAITEGRHCAAAMDKYLMGYTSLI